MTLHLKFPELRRHRGKRRELLLASASLLTPVCVMAYVLAFWRLAADLGMAREAPQGFFSHWQLWIAIAAGLQLTARNLLRKTSVVGQAVPPAKLGSPATR
jgi:hypothetical protein